MELDDVGHVEHLALGGLLDGLVEGGLQAVLDHDQVGARQGDGAGEGRLQVVWLHAGVGEADDVDVAPADPLGDPGQGVEPGRHPDPAVVGGRRGAAGHGQREGEKEESRRRSHENDSHNELRTIVNCPGAVTA